MQTTIKPSNRIDNAKMVVLNGRNINTFCKYMEKMGATITKTPISRVITDNEGKKVFSALKYSTGWSCLVGEIWLNDLKKSLGIKTENK